MEDKNMIKKQSKKILALALLLVFVMALGSIAPAFAIQVSLPGDPAQFLGEPNGQDSFDNAYNWTLFDDSCFQSEITDGKYVMIAKGTAHPDHLCLPM